MSAAVIERPATAPKKSAKVGPITNSPSLATDSHQPPSPPAGEVDIDRVDYFSERFVVSLAIVSLCIKMTGRDHSSDSEKIPELVWLGMAHVQRLMAEVEAVVDASTRLPGIACDFYRASSLVEMFNEFCFDYGGGEFCVCDETVCNMLWGIQTALDRLEDKNQGRPVTSGEAA